MSIVSVFYFLSLLSTYGYNEFQSTISLKTYITYAIGFSK